MSQETQDALKRLKETTEQFTEGIETLMLSLVDDEENPGTLQHCFNSQFKTIQAICNALNEANVVTRVNGN